MAWLLADKVFRLSLSLVAGLWVARYLGPSQYGTWNYAIALVGLFSSVQSLGLATVVVRRIVLSPQGTGAVLGTASLLQLLGGGVACTLTIIAVYQIRPDDRVAAFAVTILSYAAVFKFSDVVRYWFESQIVAKPVVWIENTVLVVFAVLKVALVAQNAPFDAFVWLAFAEAAFLAIGLFAVYLLATRPPIRWTADLDLARSLLQESWPLIVSGMAVAAGARIDQIMLGQMLGDTALGIFSAAVRISEILYFVPMMVATAVYPLILKARQQGPSQYQQQMSQLFNGMASLAFAVALVTSFFAGDLVKLLFGSPYASAAEVLRIQAWASVFVYTGILGGRWLLVEGLQLYAMYRAIFGVVINIMLNLKLIPEYGAVGAAWATVVSQAASGFFFNALDQKTRPLFFMQARSLSGLHLLKLVSRRISTS